MTERNGNKASYGYQVDPDNARNVRAIVTQFDAETKKTSTREYTFEPSTGRHCRKTSSGAVR